MFSMLGSLRSAMPAPGKCSGNLKGSGWPLPPSGTTGGKILTLVRSLRGGAVLSTSRAYWSCGWAVRVGAVVARGVRWGAGEVARVYLVGAEPALTLAMAAGVRGLTGCVRTTGCGVAGQGAGGGSVVLLAAAGRDISFGGAFLV